MTDTRIHQEHGEGEAVNVALQQRILRGLDLWSEKHHEIVWIADDRCYVPSRTRPGKRYLVVFGEDGERCRCRDFEIHGAENGACLHTVAALVAWSKRVSYEVRRGHDSRWMRDVYQLVEIRGGTEREIYQSASCSEVYWMKWSIEAGEEAA